MTKIKNNDLIFFLLIIFLCLPAILPYFHSGYFPTHDGEWAVVRLGDMYRSISDLQFPVRYSGYLNFGYGYPLFNFAYPFPYYLGLLFMVFQLGLVGSIKALFAISVPLASLFMFLASRLFWKNNLAGFVSAILYTYFPYRFVDLYVRGSLGESLSFVLFPLIFYSIIKYIRNKSFFYLVLASVAYGMLVPMHNIMALLFTPIIILFLVSISIAEKQISLRSIILFFILSYMLSAFFWIPAILEKQYILLSQIPIADRSLYFATVEQLVFPSWGYGVPTESNGFSYQIGWPYIIILFFTLVVLGYRWLKKLRGRDEKFNVTGTLAIYAVCMIYLMLANSSFFWKLPLLSEINYPWTLLSQIGFLISFFAGHLFLEQKIWKYLVLVLTVIAFMSFVSYAHPNSYIERKDEYYITNQATTTSSNELMPLWVKNHPKEMYENKVDIKSGSGEIRNLTFDSNNVEFIVDLFTKSTIRINTIFYPGWEIEVDNKMSEFNYGNEKGVMEIVLPQGYHIVNAKFSETPIRMMSNAISLFGLVIVGFILAKEKYFTKK